MEIWVGKSSDFLQDIEGFREEESCSHPFATLQETPRYRAATMG